MTREHSDDAYEVVLIRHRDVMRRGPRDCRELASRAACPECGGRTVRVSRRDAGCLAHGAGSTSESSGAAWELLRLAGLFWLLSQPIVLLGLGLAMGWYVIVATRDVVDDELGR
jgi:hypothetical protein